ncbi:pyrroline-5-carboxylate reductase [Thermodesulforhabdus norvegica]|uniref:Pyrroline-5-carboxylate reductase n=1 Tax=Thermodesulforhabdus norvegica TaxID=39841 RepID=A0A1I4S5N7_9BACT|nr:pyrroline-5-carboxylate reductase [Thermodesulforhabdus norvegica]SFM59812.1 pyrroline-5-carboxylate reductase [Thermodesulforhabdus norvegica]
MSAGVIGFIGAGNMGSALIGGIVKARCAGPENIIVYDVIREKSLDLRNRYNVTIAESLSEVVIRAGTVVLAVKPQNMSEVLDEISTTLKNVYESGAYPLMISIAAGISLGYLEERLPEGVPLIRVMPNTPALVLKGASALARNAHVRDHQMEWALKIFQSVGFACEVEEKLMDAVTGLSGSGPAYVLLFLEALTDAGVFTGLPRPLARELVLHTVAGTVALVQETNKHFADLKDMVTSPGGTTIHGLRVLECAGFRGNIFDAVMAAARRSKELGT